MAKAKVNSSLDPSTSTEGITPQEQPARKPRPAQSAASQLSPAERIQALEEEIARIRRDEHDSRYTLITTAIAELNAMGYPYRLVDDTKGQSRATKKVASTADTRLDESAVLEVPPVSARYDEKKYCKLCQENGHDMKAHTRAGEFQSRAFSNEEKARRGVLPPELQETFLAEQG